MLAIRLFGLALAAELDGPLGTDFTGLRNEAAAYVANSGYDPQVKGMRYATNFQSCEPEVTVKALETPTNGRPFAGGPRIDHLVLNTPAFRAAHNSPTPDYCRQWRAQP